MLLTNMPNQSREEEKRRQKRITLYGKSLCIKLRTKSTPFSVWKTRCADCVYELLRHIEKFVTYFLVSREPL